MKNIIFLLVVLISFTSFNVNAEKPKWAGEKTPPSAEDRAAHKDEMTSKNDEKSNKEKEKEAKEKKVKKEKKDDQDDSEKSKKDKKKKNNE